jgi:hypothetical protein
MRHGWLTIPVTMAVVVAGCSGEDIAEQVLEDRIESGAGEDVDIDFDDDGFSIQSEDGEFSFEIDEDDGNVSISGSGEDGDFTIQSEDGETVIETEDGTSIIGSDSGELPDGFPDEVPMPDGLAIDYSQATTTPDGNTFTVGGNVSSSPADVMDDYAAALDDAGFEQVQVTTTPDGGFFAYDAGEYQISGSISVGDSDDQSFVLINVTPAATG